MAKKYLNYLIVILISILFAYALVLAGVPKVLVFLLVILLIMGMMIGYPFYVVYRSRSLKLTGRYLSAHREKPIFGYAYSLSHGDTEEVIEAIKRVIASYSQQEIQETYKAELEFFKKDWHKLIVHAEKMENGTYRNYYAGIGYTMRNEEEKASRCFKNVRVAWMHHAMLAVMALKKGDLDAFSKESEAAVKSTVGMQRYVLFHTLRRLKESQKQRTGTTS